MIKKKEKEVRSPFNLAVVLDRSGSMQSHSRLTFAKNAILEVIDHLIPEDRVHFITYGTFHGFFHQLSCEPLVLCYLPLTNDPIKPS